MPWAWLLSDESVGVAEPETLTVTVWDTAEVIDADVSGCDEATVNVDMPTTSVVLGLS
jgi:hypothetical protein